MDPWRGNGANGVPSDLLKSLRAHADITAVPGKFIFVKEHAPCVIDGACGRKPNRSLEKIVPVRRRGL